MRPIRKRALLQTTTRKTKGKYKEKYKKKRETREGTYSIHCSSYRQPKRKKERERDRAFWPWIERQRACKTQRGLRGKMAMPEKE